MICLLYVLIFLTFFIVVPAINKKFFLNAWLSNDGTLVTIITYINAIFSALIVVFIFKTPQDDGSELIISAKPLSRNKVILIKIPEKTFNSKMIRNVLATFYLSKIWLSKQLGATESKTELFINEIHQSYNMQLLMEDILVECRKFNLVPTLALHYLGQCTNKLKNSILASGASFLLISGCDVKAFTELKAHFEKYGYSEADLVELERYNALCLIKNEENNYSAFVTRLPA